MGLPHYGGINFNYCNKCHTIYTNTSNRYCEECDNLLLIRSHGWCFGHQKEINQKRKTYLRRKKLKRILF